MPSTSPLVAVEQDIKEKKVAEVTDMVNEVSELIAKALKLTEGSTKPEKSTKLPIVALPRPRRSFLPTASGTTFKQRMSIVVKTTLNSPARKLATGNPIGRRSCMPASKTAPIGNSGYRKSLLPRVSQITSSKEITVKATHSAVDLAVVTARPINTFKCRLCSATFREQNLLDTHMDSHLKSALITRNKNSFFCKYCDKKFVLERALHIHLMQNCDKIPPGEKRKLEYTELNHVKKAKLPKLVPSSSAVSFDNSKPRESIMQKLEKQPPTGKFKPRTGRNSFVTFSAFVATTNNSCGGTDPARKDVKMAPPSVKKAPKRVAHAGVYRTPTKSVPCHICKQSFKSILDYTNHCLTVHSKNKKSVTTNALSALDED